MSAFFWDYQIISLIALALFFLYYTVLAIKKIEMTRSSRYRNALLASGIFCLVFILVVAYGSFIAPHRYQINEVSITVGKTPEKEEIKIVLLADLHAGPYKSSGYFKRVARSIEEINPDIIVMAGDYIYDREDEVWAIEPLKKVTLTIPTYAITGNHDYGIEELGLSRDFRVTDKTGDLKRLFAEMKITVLANQGRLINVHDRLFYLGGLEELWTQTETANRALKNIGGQVSATMTKVLLAHNPDVILEPNAAMFDLVLTGHTHGGQICLPLIGPVPSIPTKLGRSFDQGLFHLENGSQLFITRGIGESGPRARLYCRPEISVITLDL